VIKYINAARLFILVLLLTPVLVSIAFAHPSDGYPTQDLHSCYGTDSYGLGPEYDVNDLYFVKPLPDPDTLSNAEKYILAGLTQDGPGNMRRPYYTEICEAVFGYYLKTGEILPAVSAEMHAELICGGPDKLTAEMLEPMKSPITGEFPRLDATAFSPGDFYIRPLSKEEVAYIASKSDSLKALWFDGVLEDPIDGNDQQVRLIGDTILYVRVYGENEVILTKLYYEMVDAR